jgi:hypothetical protein
MISTLAGLSTFVFVGLELSMTVGGFVARRANRR